MTGVEKDDQLQLAELEQRHRELELVFETIRDVSSTLSLREVLSRLLRRTMCHLESEIGSILFLDNESEDVMRIAVAYGLPDDVIENTRVRVGDGISGHVAATRQPLLVRDLGASEFSGQNDERYYTRSLLSAPIVYQGRLYGVININNKHSRSSYTDGDLKLMRHLAAHAAVAVANARTYEDLLDRAQHDALTGLANHGFFWSALDREWERADRYGRELSVVMMDLDNFKQSNDRHGHLSGDAALRAVSEILVEGVRTADLAARYGGDEFAVLLPETSSAGAVAFAEKIRQAVAASRLGADDAPVTISLGVATRAPGSSMKALELVEAADRELYRAKKLGRNRVCAPGDSTS